MRFHRVGLPLLIGCALSSMLPGCGGGGGGGSSVTPEKIDKPPTLTLVSPTSLPATLNVATDKSITLRVKVDDPDTSDLSLVTTWDSGSVSPSDLNVKAGTEQPLVFTAPSVDKTCNITISVNDGEYTATKTITINITGNSTSGDKVAITGFAKSAETVEPGKTISIIPTISNPEGKTLTYQWRCTGGSLVNKNGESTTWTAPSEAGLYGVYLKVFHDGVNIESGCLVAANNGDGGLLAKYCQTDRVKNVVEFQETVFTRTDPNVNFEWGKLGPGHNLGPEGFGVIWTGYVKCETPGTYIFRAHVDDGARMWIVTDSGDKFYAIPNDRENWIDHPGGAWVPYQGLPVTLEGGKWYPIHLEFFQGGTDAYITLYWTVNGGTEEIVPQSALKPE